MDTNKMDSVSLGADVGGRDAFEATEGEVLKLRRALIRSCLSAHNGTVSEIALVLRIDGNIQSWGKVGVDNIVFKDGKKRVEADIFVTSDVWKKKGLFREYMIKTLIGIPAAIAEKAQKRKVVFDSESWSADISRATSEYGDE